MIETKCTIRVASKIFGVSRSTVHKDMRERLLEINPQDAIKVKQIIMMNKEHRSERGGETTKLKYKRVQ